jgi:hypothetical protein
MKKILVWTIVLMFVLQGIQLAAAATPGTTSTGTDIQISLVNQDPDPVQPGKNVDVRLRVENRGSIVANDFEIQVLPDYPFSTPAGEDSIKQLGSIWRVQQDIDTAIVKFTLHVDDNAATGTNLLRVRYRVSGGAWVEPDVAYEITIKRTNTIVDINSITITPQIIAPGQTAQVKLVLENTVNQLVQNVQLKLDLSGTTLPFVPIGSTNEITIYELKPNEQKEFTFTLIAKPDASSDVYKIPLILTYSDIDGTVYTKTNIFGLTIGGKPELDVIIDSSTIYSTNTVGTVTIKTINRGSSDLRFVNLVLQPSANYDIVSSASDYLGKVDSDDYGTSQFKIFVKTVKDHNVELPVTLTFRDAINNEYEQSYNLTLMLYTQEQAEKLGIAKGGSILGILIVIVVIVGAGYYFLRRKKKK